MRQKIWLALSLAVVRSPLEPAASPPAPVPGAPPAPPAPPAPVAGVPPAPSNQTKPELLPDRWWNGDKKEVRWQELNGEFDVLRQFKAEQDVRMQGVPKEANGYALSLDGFEIPQGIEFKLDDANPMVGPARDWALKWGVPQEGFKELTHIYARSQVDSLQAFNAEVAAEKTKLGQASAQRVEAVETALKGRIGDRAVAITPMLVTAAAIEAFEALLRTTSVPGPGSQGQLTNKPDYSKMSHIERIHYAHERSTKKVA